MRPGKAAILVLNSSRWAIDLIITLRSIPVLGSTRNHMRLKQNITFQKDKSTLTYMTDAVDYKKNRFSESVSADPAIISIPHK